MPALHTLKKRQVDVVAHLKRVPEQLAIDVHQDPFALLYPNRFQLGLREYGKESQIA